MQDYSADMPRSAHSERSYLRALRAQGACTTAEEHDPSRRSTCHAIRIVPCKGRAAAHFSHSCVRGCANLLRRAVPSSVAASDTRWPPAWLPVWLPARAVFVHGLQVPSLRRSARMRSARAARELPGCALFSLNSLRSTGPLLHCLTASCSSLAATPASTLAY